MATITGTVRKLGIEGGLWALITDEGEQYHLVEAPEQLLEEGLRVEVKGEVPQGASIAMVGSMLRVKSFRRQ
jgi:hypothetical protein